MGIAGVVLTAALGAGACQASGDDEPGGQDQALDATFATSVEDPGDDLLDRPIHGVQLSGASGIVKWRLPESYAAGDDLTTYVNDTGDVALHLNISVAPGMSADQLTGLLLDPEVSEITVGGTEFDVARVDSSTDEPDTTYFFFVPEGATDTYVLHFYGDDLSDVAPDRVEEVYQVLGHLDYEA